MTISAILEGKIREAEWDAEEARLRGDTGALLDAISTWEALKEQRTRLADPAWMTALETEM